MPDKENENVVSTTEVKSEVETDIEKIDNAISALKSAGEELFTDEIKALKIRKEELETKLKEEKEKIEEDIEKDASGLWDKIKSEYSGYVKEPLFILIVFILIYIAIRLN